MRNIFSVIILGIACAFAMISCDSSSQDKINTKPATVSFKSDTIFVKENKGLFDIPLEISGERDGMIKVKIVTIANENCKEDVNFIITSKEINISESKNTVNIECNTVDDKTINDDRTFIIKIADVNGATINDAASSIVIKILDNDNTPYDRMAGKWTITANDNLMDGIPEYTWNVTIETVDIDDSLNYGTLLYVVPFAIGGGSISSDFKLPMFFKWNDSTQKGTVEVKESQNVGSIKFQLDGDAEQVDYTIRPYCYGRSAMGEVSTDLNSIKIPDLILGQLFKTEDMNPIPIEKAVLFGWSNMIITRKE